MKIGIDCRSLEGQKTGVGVYLSNLMRNIIKLADESIRFICYFEHEIPTVSWLCDKRLETKIIKLPIQNNLLWSSVRLPLELIKDRVDLYHSPSYTTPFFKVKKTIVTIHDISYAVNPKWYAYKLGRFREYYYYKSAKHADKIITVSEFSKTEIVRQYKIDDQKVKVIYHGLDEKFLKNSSQEEDVSVLDKHGIKGDYLLYIGSIHFRRNVRRLIEAFVKLKNDYEDLDDLKLVIVGKDEGTLNSLISVNGNREDIIFTDYIDDNDICCLYKRAMCFLFLSFYEGFGFPILESMASGTPVIVSNIEVFKEIYKDYVVSVDPYDVCEIKDAIYKLITNYNFRKELSVRGKDYATSFAWETTAKKTLDVYKEMF